jgi:hypothetical protein
VFSSTTIIIIREVYGAGATEGQNKSRVQIEGHLMKKILLLIIQKNGGGQ